MMYKQLKKSVEEIKMSDEMKNRIIKNCYSQLSDGEEYIMKKTNVKFKKMVLFAAVLVICVSSVGVVVANHIRGFDDVIKGTAVVGTIYDEATEMVKLDAKVKDNLIVSAEFVDFNKPPYIEIDIIAINSYKILDSSGKVIDEGSAKPISAFENGKVSYEISLDSVASGEYKLVINEFAGSKKADQPLPIKGTWECPFIK